MPCWGMLPMSEARRRNPEFYKRPAPPADYPLQTVQFDAIFSPRLTVDRHMAGDDSNYVLKVHPRPTSGPGCNNLRVVCYAVRDLCTGLTRYSCCLGESINAADAIEELRFLLSDHRDPQRPMAGLPDFLWTDSGKVMHEVAGSKHLPPDVTVIQSGFGTNDDWHRYSRTTWAALKGFENSAALGRSETTLSEWGYLLENFERNQGRQPARPPVSRTVAWTMLGKMRPANKPLRPWPKAVADA